MIFLKIILHGLNIITNFAFFFFFLMPSCFDSAYSCCPVFYLLAALHLWLCALPSLLFPYPAPCSHFCSSSCHSSPCSSCPCCCFRAFQMCSSSGWVGEGVWGSCWESIYYSIVFCRRNSQINHPAAVPKLYEMVNSSFTWTETWVSSPGRNILFPFFFHSSCGMG